MWGGADFIFASEVDYNRLGAIIYGGYYAVMGRTDACMVLGATVKR